jgi:hypothetical protein
MLFARSRAQVNAYRALDRAASESRRRNMKLAGHAIWKHPKSCSSRHRGLAAWVACALAFMQLGFANAEAMESLAEIPQPSTADPSEYTQLRENYDRLPLRFEENRGQLDAPVKYVSVSGGMTLFLTPRQAVMSVHERAAVPPSIVRMTFERTRGAKSVIGEEPAATESNYFVGSNAATWRTHVPNFCRVRYHEIYPGIDVVYYGTEHRLEYDFVLAPGARAEDIDVAFESDEKIHIDRDGDLVLHTAAGDLRQKKPIAYQVINGHRRSTSARYVRRGRRAIGIALGSYDHRKAVIIDPLILSYATYLSGTDSEKGLSIAVDNAGNAYATGFTRSIDFPTANAAQPANHGAADIFVSKLNASGTALIYSTYLGGGDIDVATGITRDSAGAVYITGYTASNNFPVTPNALQSGLKGSAYDAFVTKLGSSGALQYSTYLGGSDLDTANAIAVDASGNAYVTGFTCSTDFPVMAAFQPFLNGAPGGCFAGWDAFVSKLNPNGSALVYSTYFGGNDKDQANGIAVDAQDRASITGFTRSVNLPTTGFPLSAYKGASDAFVARFTPTGWLDYSTFFGGSAYDEGTAIAVDASGALYTTGFTASIDFPTVNAFQPNFHGGEDAFVLKLAIDPGGATVVVGYSSYLGGGEFERGHAIAVDASGYAYVAGSTTSLDFPLQLATQPMLKGPSDAFVAQIAPGGSLSYSTFLGGSDEDEAFGIALSNGHLKTAATIYVTGVTSSTDLSTPSAFQRLPRGGVDAFVAKIGYVP